jgi:hypothetical protein
MEDLPDTIIITPDLGHLSKEDPEVGHMSGFRSYEKVKARGFRYIVQVLPTKIRLFPEKSCWSNLVV